VTDAGTVATLGSELDSATVAGVKSAVFRFRRTEVVLPPTVEGRPKPRLETAWLGSTATVAEDDVPPPVAVIVDVVLDVVWLVWARKVNWRRNWGTMTLVGIDENG
jgi:hypothetical protein